MQGDHISLFSGIGLTDLAAERAGFNTVVTAEINPYCRSVLKARFPLALHAHSVEDVKAADWAVLGAEMFRRPLLMSGGFPCQGFAPSGYKHGMNDARSGLWREFNRCIREFRPDYVLIENSNLLRKRGLNKVLFDLAVAGYDARWECIAAGHVGAPHVRDRIWIMAVPTGKVDYLSAHASDDFLGAINVPMGEWMRYKFGANGNQPYPVTELPRAGIMVDRALAAIPERYPLVKARRAVRALPQSYPTPTLSDGTGGPGTTPKREGGKNLRTVVNELEGNGRLHPTWLEWLMGAPLGWSDPSVPNSSLAPTHPWVPSMEPRPRTADPRMMLRGERVKALGNALVPAVAEIALQTLLDWS